MFFHNHIKDILKIIFNLLFQMKNLITNPIEENFQIFLNQKTKITKLGRKKKNDKSIRKHNNRSLDNCIKKIKVNSNLCFHLTSNQIINDKNIKLTLIDNIYIKNGKKSFNISLLNMTFQEIYKTKKNNIEIIEKFSSDELFKEIIDMTFSEFINRIFMMKSSEFEAKYSFYNKYLFENLQIEDEEEKSIIKNLIGYGLLNYFDEIKERKSKKDLIKYSDTSIPKKANDSYFSKDNQFSENFENQFCFNHLINIGNENSEDQ